MKLADAAEIVIRPIEPEDLNELAIGFGGLGSLSRFRRFRQRIDRLTYEQLVALTRIDHESHEALVAIDAATGEGVGVARYVRVPDDPARAEVACTVVDPWQRRGVGSALAERLAARAGAAGIERCTALVVLGDQPARRLLARVVDEIAVQRDGGTWTSPRRLGGRRHDRDPRRTGDVAPQPGGRVQAAAGSKACTHTRRQR